MYEEIAKELDISGNTDKKPYLSNSSEETIFGSNKIKEQHETIKI